MFKEQQRQKLADACGVAFPTDGEVPDLQGLRAVLIAAQHVLMHHPCRVHFEQFDSARVLVEEAALWVQYADEMIQREKDRINASGTTAI